MKEHNYYVYILTNWNRKVMYIGITSNLQKRIYEHKNRLIEGFTQKYNIDKLVYYEHFTDVNEAIKREKVLKGWTRKKKDDLVESINPYWKDLTIEYKLL